LAPLPLQITAKSGTYSSWGTRDL
jgi:hypothetical protein